VEQKNIVGLCYEDSKRARKRGMKPDSKNIEGKKKRKKKLRRSAIANRAKKGRIGHQATKPRIRTKRKQRGGQKIKSLNPRTAKKTSFAGNQPAVWNPSTVWRKKGGGNVKKRLKKKGRRNALATRMIGMCERAKKGIRVYNRRGGNKAGSEDDHGGDPSLKLKERPVARRRNRVKKRDESNSQSAGAKMMGKTQDVAHHLAEPAEEAGG